MRYKAITRYTPFLLLMVFLSLVEIGFTWLNHGVVDRASLAVEKVFRSGGVIDPFDVVRDITELSRMGFIDCVSMELGSRVYLETFEVHGCQASPWSFNKSLTKQYIQSLNGQNWLVKYRVQDDRFLILALWLSRILGGLTVLLLGLAWQRRSQQLTMAFEISRAEALLMRQNARQVRHDVASPISALRAASRFPGISLDLKDFLEKVSRRTEEIFADLESLGSDGGRSFQDFAVEGVVAEVVTEKQSERIVLETRGSMKVRGNRADFARAISNILDNALEANGMGQVLVGICGREPNVYIEVRDMGPGFPDELIVSGPRYGHSVGKLSGSGLGLFQAERSIRKMGGRLVLKNISAHGATHGCVEIVVPVSG